MTDDDHDRFMGLTLEEVRTGALPGNAPVGSVDVRGNEVNGSKP